MMRYMAILKDSMREALDSKVLYVMIGLSTIVILVVASLSFKPLPAEKTMERFFWSDMQHPFKEDETIPQPPTFSGMLASKEKKKGDLLENALRIGMMYPYRLAKVEATGGAEDAPDGEYVLAISRIIPKGDKKMMALAELGGNDPEKQLQIVKSLFEDAESGGYLNVEKVERTKIEDPEKETARFHVTVKGTSKTVRIWVTEPSWIFGMFRLRWMTGPLAQQMSNLAYIVIAIGAWVTILVGIVITSFFFPNMLRKGTVDLLLVKPVQRWALLLYKYVGGLMFIFVCTSYTMIGIWFVLGIRSGLWPNGSLLIIGTLTFFFAILYSISTFVGVLTRSTVTTIMLTAMAYAALGTSGTVHEILEAKVKEEEAREQVKARMKVILKDAAKEEDDEDDSRWADGYMVATSRAIQTVSPRTEDLNQLNRLIIYTDFMTGNPMDMGKYDTGERNYWISFLVCVIWIGIFLGLACLWFTFKDY